MLFSTLSALTYYWLLIGGGYTYIGWSQGDYISSVSGGWNPRVIVHKYKYFTSTASPYWDFATTNCFNPTSYTESTCSTTWNAGGHSNAGLSISDAYDVTTGPYAAPSFTFVNAASSMLIVNQDPAVTAANMIDKYYMVFDNSYTATPSC